MRKAFKESYQCALLANSSLKYTDSIQRNPVVDTMNGEIVPAPKPAVRKTKLSIAKKANASANDKMVHTNSLQHQHELTQFIL
jgi:hypothetical protein